MAPAGILIDCGIAVRDDVAPSSQDRTSYSLLIMKSLSAADSAPQTSPLRPASCAGVAVGERKGFVWEQGKLSFVCRCAPKSTKVRPILKVRTRLRAGGRTVGSAGGNIIVLPRRFVQDRH